MSRGLRRGTVSAVLLLVSTAGCAGGDVATAGTESHTADVPPTMVAGTLETLETSIGPILVDGNGHTVYVFSADVPGDSSACEAACLKTWPALDSPAAHAGKGVTASLIGTIIRTDGTEQLTYALRPLYYFSHDDAVGDVEGHRVTSFGGTWRAVRPDGTPVGTSLDQP